jgi:signal transduction histidine kinase
MFHIQPANELKNHIHLWFLHLLTSMFHFHNAQPNVIILYDFNTDFIIFFFPFKDVFSVSHAFINMLTSVYIIPLPNLLALWQLTTKKTMIEYFTENNWRRTVIVDSAVEWSDARWKASGMDTHTPPATSARAGRPHL